MQHVLLSYFLWIENSHWSLRTRRVFKIWMHPSVICMSSVLRLYLISIIFILHLFFNRAFFYVFLSSLKDGQSVLQICDDTLMQYNLQYVHIADLYYTHLHMHSCETGPRLRLHIDFWLCSSKIILSLLLCYLNVREIWGKSHMTIGHNSCDLCKLLPTFPLYCR